MNREKEDMLPKMQVNFIDSVCLPVYDAFATLFPDKLSCLRTGVLKNRTQWLILASQQHDLKDWAAKELEKHHPSKSTLSSCSRGSDEEDESVGQGSQETFSFQSQD